VSQIIKVLSLLSYKSIKSILRHFYMVTKLKSKTDEIQSVIKDIKDCNTYVEIGVEYGHNLIALAKRNKATKFIGIDPYSFESFIVKGEKRISYWSYDFDNAYNYFISKSKRLTNIDLIKDYSSSAVTRFKNESLDMVFIDAAHDYLNVKNDIELWLPKVRKGGVLAGHDYSLRFLGVVKAVNDTVGFDKVSIRSDDTWFYFKD
jgi:hypothetical protein